MNHFAAPRFWRAYEVLPVQVRELADKAYKLLRTNPKHSSLQLKRIGKLWSVRVGIHYRALGTDVDGDILWIWIGTHADYDKLIR